MSGRIVRYGTRSVARRLAYQGAATLARRYVTPTNTMRVAGWVARHAARRIQKSWRNYRSKRAGKRRSNRTTFASNVSAITTSAIQTRTLNIDELYINNLTELLQTGGIVRNWVDITGIKVCHQLTNTEPGAAPGVFHWAMITLNKSALNLLTASAAALSAEQIIQNYFFTSPQSNNYQAIAFTDTALPQVLKNCIPICTKYLKIHAHIRRPIQQNGFGGNYNTMRVGEAIYIDKYVKMKRRLMKYDENDGSFHPPIFECYWYEPLANGQSTNPALEEIYFDKVYYRKPDV